MEDEFEIWWNTEIAPYPRGEEKLEVMQTIKSITQLAFLAGAEAKEKDWIKQQEEITDMCIVSWISTLGTLKEKVMRLIEWEVSVALDPTVSREAQALIDQGAEAQRKRDLEIIEEHKYAFGKDILKYMDDAKGGGCMPVAKRLKSKVTSFYARHGKRVQVIYLGEEEYAELGAMQFEGIPVYQVLKQSHVGVGIE